MVKKTRKKRRIWFRSSGIVLVTVFLVSFTIGFFRYGMIETFDTILKYIIGGSTLGLIIFILSIVFQKRIRKFFKS